MDEPTVRRAPLVWWLGGLLLGATQIFAVAVKKPLGVSTQFVVVESVALHKLAPDYADDHALIGADKYRTLGYGWWLDVGLVCGAALGAIVSLRWRPRLTTIWWRVSHGGGVFARLGAGFVGGFLILLGARFAHGCTSGQFAGGWAQLSLSVLPFTAAMLVFGAITARIVYPRVPGIER